MKKSGSDNEYNERHMEAMRIKPKDKSTIDLESLDKLLMEVSTIFDGWHADGTVWSEYDEAVRRRVTEFRKKYTYEK